MFDYKRFCLFWKLMFLRWDLENRNSEGKCEKKQM